MRAMTSILRAATRSPDEPLSILTACTHERYLSNLCNTSHNFYALCGSGKENDPIKDWNETYAERPKNFHLIYRSGKSWDIPWNVHFDLVLSQHKFGQFQTLAPISNYLQVPLLSLEHTLPHPSWPETHLQNIKKMSGHSNVFISDFSREKWGWAPDEAIVVRHGVDTDRFRPASHDGYRGNVLTVVNDWRSAQRRWCCGYDFWAEVDSGQNFPHVHLGFSDDGWSQPAKGVDDLVRHYQECAVFVDTANASPIPSVVLESMACGCIVVSRGNAMVPEVIQDGVNGFIRDTPDGMRSLLKEILGNPGGYSEIRRNARKTILERYSLGRFAADWDRVLRECADKPWVGPV